MGMFPTLYPYGKGGFEDPERQVAIGFCNQANLYLDLSDHVFRRHNSFIFVVMNMIQYHDTHLHTHLAIKSSNFAATAADIKGVTPETLHSVSKHLEEQGRVSDLSVDERKVFTLLSKVRMISAKITGSEASKVTYRNEIKVYCAHFNIPHIYFTANPDPVNSLIFQVVTGDTRVDLDEHFPHMVDYVCHCLCLAVDPVAALDFFNFSCKMMMHYLFGWDFAKKQSSVDRGILGHLKAFYGTNELTKRGSYHVHYLIILLGGLNPLETHQHLDDTEDFQNCFFTFYEDIIHHDLPEDIYFNPKGKPKTERPISIPKEAKCSSEAIADFKCHFQEDVKYCRELLQRHKHKNVCYKYDHATCRFQFPHEYAACLLYEKDTKSVTLACRDVFVNYFNEFILVFCWHNHNMQCILSGKSCKAAMCYIMDYITKMSVKTYKMLSLMADAVMKASNNLSDRDCLKVQIILHKCLTQFASQQQVHAQHDAKVIHGQQEVFCSHRTILMMSGILMEYVGKNWLYEHEDDTTEEEPAYIGVCLDKDSHLIQCNQVEKYLQCSTAIKHILFYDFIHCFSVILKGAKPDMELLEDFTVTNRITKFPRHLFHLSYHLSKTHEIIEHTSETQSWFMMKTVPRVIAHKIPRLGDPCYEMFMLAHFKPFNID